MAKRKKVPPEIFSADLTITHLGRGGDGVAQHEGQNIFVPFALPGERISATITRHPKFGNSAKLDRLHDAAATRAAPPCIHFATCGGCALQHMDADSYREYKIGLLKHEFDRAGLTYEVILPLASSPPGSRRRAVFSARKFKDGKLSVGFNERGANWLVDALECHTVKPQIEALLPPLRLLLSELLEPSDKVDVAVTWFREGLDVVLIGLPRLDWQGREKLAQFGAAHGICRLSVRARKIKDREPIYQSAKPSCTFGAVTVHPPAGSFLQATLEGEAAMVRATRDAIEKYAPNARLFADLFCGSGTFSGVLADYGNVLSVEFEGDSLAALTAAKSPRIFTRAQDLMAEPLMPVELNTRDVVLIDPPRAGCKAQAEQLAQSKVPLVISISCNPETFARDARILIAGGYRLREVTPVDQFLWSPHLEVVGIFTR